jgi:hypothetical protein
LILIVPLILGIIVVLVGAHYNLSYLIAIGVSVISGTVTGFFMSLTASEVTATATSKATYAIQIRNEHLQEIKNLFMQNGTLVNADYIRTLLGDPSRLSKNALRDREYLLDIKIHWPEIFETFEQDKLNYDNVENYKKKLNDDIRKSSEVVASESLEKINKDIEGGEVLLKFFQTKVDPSSINAKALRFTGGQLDNFVNGLTNLIVNGIVPTGAISNNNIPEAKDQITKNLSDYLKIQMRVSDNKNSMGVLPLEMANLIRESMENNVPHPTRNLLINDIDSHRAIQSIVNNLLDYVKENDNIDKIMNKVIDLKGTDGQIQKSGEKVEDAVRYLSMTKILPNDCVFIKEDQKKGV